MGRWTHFSGISIGVENLEGAVAEMLKEYGDVVYVATEEGLDAATKVLVKNLKAATPKRTGKFAKGWKSRGKKYKLRRYVGNTTTVEGKGKGGRREEIALANIFEYSTTRGRPFIKRTYENSIDEMARAVVAEIKKEV